RNLTASDSEMTRSLAKLSSGSRVVSARDDAAAMAIGSRISSEVAALKQANVNAGQASSMLQIADGAMANVSDILTRMKTLAVQASSGQISNTEREMLDTEYQSLLKEVDRISQDTEFNGNKLVGGGEVQTIQTGFTLANTLLGTEDGFASIKFDQSVGDAAFQFSWDQSSTTLTLTNAKTGASESVNVGSTAITSTEEVRFAQLGATVTLNSNFNKAAADWSPAANTDLDTISGSIVGAELDASNDASGEAIAAIDSINIVVGGTAEYATLDLVNSGTENNFTLVEVDGQKASPINLSDAGSERVTLENSRTGDRITVDLSTSGGWDGVGGNLALGELNSTVFAAQDPDAGSFTFKLGTGVETYDKVTFEIGSVSTKALGVDGASIATAEDADKAITAIGGAINTLNTNRADVGASQNRLEFAASNLASTIE